MKENLKIQYPRSHRQERLYVLTWIFEEVFGLLPAFEASDLDHYLITLEGDEVAVKLPDFVFTGKDTGLPEDYPLPIDPPRELHVQDGEQEEVLSVLFAEGGQGSERFILEESAPVISIPLDVVGSLFFLMAGLDDQASKQTDEHGRFSANHSYLVRNGLIERPIGNEYLSLLEKVLSKAFPSLRMKRQSFRLLPSHDIDHPSAYWNRHWKTLLKIAAKWTTEGRVGEACRLLREAQNYPKRGWQNDPYDCIDWIMQQSEAAGTQSAFYYIPEQTNRDFDPGMPIESPQVAEQWQRIAEQGHEIGIHPGYETYQDPALMLSGANRLKEQLSVLGIEQKEFGGRQHFLRWSNAETARHYESAGIAYDSSVGFADRPGFRAGLCYEFPLYDMESRRSLSVRERPLIVMDCSVIDSRYMGLGCSEDSFNLMRTLKDECRKYQGDFTLLWHNQRFAKNEERELYASILRA